MQDAPAPTAARRRLFVAFAIPGYRWFWTSMLWSSAAVTAAVLARGWLVLDLAETNAPLWLGAVSAVRSLGSVGLAPLGGILADRMDRRLTLIAVSALMAATSLTLALLIATDAVRIWHVLALSAVEGVSMSVNMPSRNALTFDLAGRGAILNAMSANFLAGDVMHIISPLAGGLLVATIGAGGAYFFIFGCHCLAAASLVPVRVPRRQSVTRAPMARDLREGVAYALRTPAMRVIMVADFVSSLFAFSYSTMLPLFARDILGVGAMGFGFLMAADGAGAVGAGAVIASAPRLRTTHRRFLATALGFSALIALFAASPWFATSLVALTLVGVARAGYNSLASSLVQLVARDDLRGRMVGLQAFTWGFTPVGGLLSGAVASVLGVPLGVGLLAGVACVVLVPLVLRAKRYAASV